MALRSLPRLLRLACPSTPCTSTNYAGLSCSATVMEAVKASVSAVPTLRSAWNASPLARPFSTEEKNKTYDSAAGPSSSAEQATSDEQSTNSQAAEEPRSVEELQSLLDEKNATLTDLKGQVDGLTDKLKRSLADMENLRFRTARDLDNAQKFAVQGFVKALLDVPDNLQRAAESVPKDALEGDSLEKDRAVSLLRGLVEGVQMTERVLQQVLKKHGVEQYDPVGAKFDPNEHNALFEVPDPSKEAGTVAVVTKRGYKLHERVVRPAEVGVVKAP